MVKAKSIIDQNVSEVLVKQGFEVVFEELKSYLAFLKNPAIELDWESYCKERNLQRDKGKFENLNKQPKSDSFDYDVESIKSLDDISKQR